MHRLLRLVWLIRLPLSATWVGTGCTGVEQLRTVRQQSHLTVHLGSGGTSRSPSAVDAANGTNIAATQLTLNPTMGPDEALYWIDQIQDYTAPRLAAKPRGEAGPGCNDETACNYNRLGDVG